MLDLRCSFWWHCKEHSNRLRKLWRKQTKWNLQNLPLLMNIDQIGNDMIPMVIKYVFHCYSRGDPFETQSDKTLKNSTEFLLSYQIILKWVDWETNRKLFQKQKLNKTHPNSTKLYTTVQQLIKLYKTVQQLYTNIIHHVTQVYNSFFPKTSKRLYKQKRYTI